MEETFVARMLCKSYSALTVEYTLSTKPKLNQCVYLISR